MHWAYLCHTYGLIAVIFMAMYSMGTVGTRNVLIILTQPRKPSRLAAQFSLNLGRRLIYYSERVPPFYLKSMLTQFSFVLTITICRVLRLRRNTYWQQYASFYCLVSLAGLRILGKGGLFATPPLEDALLGLRALPLQLEQVALIYSLSVALWPTAKH